MYNEKDFSIIEFITNPRSLKQSILIFLSGLLISGTFFTVDPTEMANIRRFGNVVYEQPLEKGLHFKIPIIDSVDKIQISLKSLSIPDFKALTIDNQQITLSINFNYEIPQDAVNYLMYQVGKSGNADIDNQIISITEDRTQRIFSTQNMTSINANREQIQQKVEQFVFQSVKDTFKIKPHSLQISALTPSDVFMKSVESATKAKNDAVAAENQKATVQYQADQRVIQAKGEADAMLAKANAQAQATILIANAEKQRLLNEIEPFGSAATYVDYIRLKSWNGTVPQVVTSGNSNGSNVVIPLQMK